MNKKMRCKACAGLKTAVYLRIFRASVTQQNAF